MNDVLPFSSALIYRTRYWWRHKIRGKPVPTPYDGPIPHWVDAIYALSPLDIPFLQMVGKPEGDKVYTFDPETPPPSIRKDADDIVAGPGLLERLREMNEGIDDDLT
jgi:hypothetical protein